MKLDHHAGFEALLHPIEPAFFFEEVYERRPMLVDRQDRTYYADVCDLKDIDSLLQSPAIASKFLRLHDKGKEIPSYKWSRGNEVDFDAVSSLFVNGATVIINSANKFFPRLAAYCNNVERQMRFAVQPNIYITPAGSHGFDRHYDDHDVFIMQILGSKNWRLYGSPVELPSRNQKHEWGKYLSLPMKEGFLLKTGDLLYIPRGHLHDADTNLEASIHITFGLHPPYLYELAEELARHSKDSPAFRRSLPGFMMRPDEFGVRMKEQLRALVDEADIEKLLSEIDRRFISSRNPGRQSHFHNLLTLPNIDESMNVIPIRSLLYRLERENGQVHLRLSGIDLKFPSFMEDTLRNLLESDSQRIADISGLLDKDGRIALVKQLIAAGVLQLQS